MLQTLSTGKSAHFIHEFRDTSGEAHFCEVSTYPLVNKQGKMVQVLEVFRDITNELAERVENRTRAIKKDLSRLVQEDKLLSLGKLVASVAHEINNPLASIINFSKLILSYLQEGPPDADQAKQWAQWLGMIQAEAERSSRIVANLLSFAREQPLEPKLIDLRELMDQIVLLTAHRMEISQVDPDYQRPAYPLWAMGDPTQIQQCFANLVFNSLEAMPEGGRLTIKGGLGPGAKVWFEVRDTGIGMDPELLPRIFEPFFSTKQQGKGVGLGLSMVYGIISEHRGRIDVDTVPDEGSTFRITLPKASQKGGKGR